MPERPADPDSLRYAAHWEPVLAGPARRLLAHIDVVPKTFLDVGAGTGWLTLAAGARWPEARIIALDASAGMLSVARQRVAVQWPTAAERFEWLATDALAMPLEAGSMDVVTSSFALAVVEDRQALLREILRVLRPGGMFGLVTWIADELRLAADVAFVSLVSEFGLGGQRRGLRPPRTTDYRTVEEAAAELATLGFEAVDARADELHHAWTREEYLIFKEEYDDRDIFESLDPAARERFRAALRARWAELPDEAFAVRGPLVLVIARRPTA